MPDESTLDTLRDQPWGDLMVQLVSYTKKAMKRYTWRGRGELIMGRTAEQIAYEAMEKLFMGDHTWNRELHPDIFDHLTDRVDSILNNLANRREHELKEEVEDYDTLENPGRMAAPPDEKMVAAESEEFDEMVIETLWEATEGEEELQLVLTAMLEGIKRRDFPEVVGISKQEYDNARRKIIRRARTLLRERGHLSE